MTLWGADVSHWNGTADVARIKGAGASFIIAKASEGHSSVDGAFVDTARQCHREQLLIGGYHFAQPGQSSGSSQASRFARILQDNGVGFGALDIEVTGGYGTSSLREWCADFLGTLRAAGIRECSYSSRSYAEALGSELFSSNTGRWIASPGYRPSIPFDLWQSSWHGRVPGLSGDVDIDTWEGDLASLALWFGAVDTPHPIAPVEPVGPSQPTQVQPATPITPIIPTPIHTEVPSMLITVGSSVFTWNFGGDRGSLMQHTNPARVRDLEAHGMRHVKPGDDAHKLYAPVVQALLAKKD